MPVDDRGNNILAVGIPITGFIGIASEDTDLLTPAAGASLSLTLPGTFRMLGLMKEDGGFNWTEEPDGDPIRFYQEGYQVPSGLAKATLEVGLAQYDSLVREVTYGKVPDEYGYITIDAGGHGTRCTIFTEEIFKNGAIRRRQGRGSVTAASRDRSTRGEVNGTNLTFTYSRSAELNNEHFGEWWIPADAPAAA